MPRIDWWVAHLEGFRKVPPANRHITVVFIGDVPSDAIDQVTGAINETASMHEPFSLRAQGVIALPNEHRQRVLAIGFDSSPGFVALVRSAQAALLATSARATVESELDRPPRPHITVARKKRTGGSRPADLVSAPPFERVVPCRAVELVRSTVTAEGPIYTPLVRIPLRGDAEC